MDLIAFFGTYLFVILVIQGLLALIPAYIAREKGRSFGAFWALGFFATVIVGLIAVLAMPALSAEERIRRAGDSGSALNPEMLKCPFCAEFIKSEAILCKHCGQSVEKEFANEIRNRHAEAKRQREQLHMQQEELLVTQNSAMAELKATRDRRNEAILEFVRSPLGKVAAAVITVVLIFSIASVVVRSSPSFASAYCNAVSSGEDSSEELITISFGEPATAIVARRSSPVFSCLTNVLMGNGDLAPKTTDYFSGYRFTAIDLKLDRWGIYRP